MFDHRGLIAKTNFLCCETQTLKISFEYFSQEWRDSEWCLNNARGDSGKKMMLQKHKNFDISSWPLKNKSWMTWTLIGSLWVELAAWREFFSGQFWQLSKSIKFDTIIRTAVKDHLKWAVGPAKNSQLLWGCEKTKRNLLSWKCLSTTMYYQVWKSI